MKMVIIILVMHILCTFIINTVLSCKIQDKEKEIDILAHDLDIAEDKIYDLRIEVAGLKSLYSGLKTRIESLEKDNDWYKKERSISD